METKPQCPQAARRTLEYGAEKEGYWTSERFMQQVESAADIAEFKYPDNTHPLVWLFNQSSCHRKMDAMALQASKLLVMDGTSTGTRHYLGWSATEHGHRR